MVSKKSRGKFKTPLLLSFVKPGTWSVNAPLVFKIIEGISESMVSDWNVIT